MPCAAVFNNVILGNQSDLSRIQFWDHVRGLKPWENHPALSPRRYKPSKLIGLCVHADGCQMYKEDEYMVWSWSSIFSREGLLTDVLVYKFPFVVVPEKYMRSAAATGFHLSSFELKFKHGFCKLHNMVVSPQMVHGTSPQKLTRFSQVKAEVERKVAQLFAWSIDCASKGVAPSVGFEGETFEKGSSRWKMQGKELAKGLRNLFQVI